MNRSDFEEKNEEQVDLEGSVKEGTQSLRRGDLVKILSQLIRYAERKLYSRSIPASEKAAWARILREAITEMNRLTRGEEEGDEGLGELLKKVSLRAVREGEEVIITLRGLKKDE